MRLPAKLLPAFGLFSVLVLWEGWVRIANVETFLLPSASAVFRTAWVKRDTLAANIGTTASSALFGFSLALVIGAVSAIACWRWVSFEVAARPVFVAAQAVPRAALATLFTVWMGDGVFPNGVIAFSIAVFPIYEALLQGLRSVSEERRRVLQAMGATPAQVIIYLLVPQALPYAFVGIRLAVIYSVVGAVTAEVIHGKHGLGYLIVAAEGENSMELKLAAVAVGVLFSLAVWSFMAHFISERRQRSLGWAQMAA